MATRTKVVISGRMGTGGEVWSTGLNFASSPPSILTAAAVQSAANAIGDGLGDVLDGTALFSGLSIAGTVSKIDVYQYPASGPAIAVGSKTVGDVTGGTSAIHPYQVSQVISSRCAVSGAKYRGRNYWPAVGTPVANTGLFNVPTAGASCADNWVELVGFIEEQLSGDGDLRYVVYSPTADIVTRVTNVSWDTVPDIQRRRADALIGLRFGADLPV